jgi:stage III sporulation protein AF
MDWLGGWLRSIVTVILLATFVDLILPSSTMQRYVKTVMSLIILLTLLSPVLQLFERKFNVDQLLTAAINRQEQSSMLASGSIQSPMKSLEAIVQDADKLKAAGQKQSQQLLQAQIAALMKEDLQKQTDLHVADVQVIAKLDNNGKPAISDVRVTLHVIEQKDRPNSVGEHSIAVMEPVRPIERVQISHETAIPTIGLSQGSDTAKPTSQQEQELTRLSQGIARDWLVEQSRVDIQLITERSKQ